MKLLIAVVSKRDSRRLAEALVEAGMRYTDMGSHKGILGEESVTLLVEAQAEEVDSILALIDERCRAREEVINADRPESRLHAAGVPEAMTARIGGARVYVMDVERMVEM